MKKYQSNGQFILEAKADLEGAVIERVELMLFLGLEVIRSLSAVERVWLYLVDPVRFFVKNEPHSVDKVLNRRFRLISSFSVVDSIVQRLATSSQNEREIGQWASCPSRPGIGFTDSMMREYVEAHSSYPSICMSDMSGWDWNVKGWEFDMDAERRVGLATECDEEYRNFIRMVMELAKLSVFMTSDGCLHAQLKPGLMKSGMYITSSSNSAIRVMLAYLAGAKWASAMGDDCTESGSCKELYEQYGHIVKNMSEVKDQWEFCSKVWTRGGVGWPTRGSADKMLFRLAHKDSSPDELLQFLSEIRHAPWEKEVRDLLTSNGYDLIERWCSTNATQEEGSREETCEEADKGSTVCQAAENQHGRTRSDGRKGSCLHKKPSPRPFYDQND